jgi:hypothetical protein
LSPSEAGHAERSKQPTDDQECSMTMPTDAGAEIPSEGSNDGPREESPDEAAVGAHVDEENVPHPPEEDTQN